MVLGTVEGREGGKGRDREGWKKGKKEAVPLFKSSENTNLLVTDVSMNTSHIQLEVLITSALP